MAISHVCMGCGYDLAHIHAHPTGPDRLWIVECPRCTRRATRHAHSIMSGWRVWRRRLRALRTLLSQAILAIVMSGLAFLMSAGLASAAIDARVDRILPLLLDPELRREPESDQALFFITGVIIVSLIAAVWLRAGLAHWRWWIAWPAWTGILFALVALPSTFCLADAAWHNSWSLEPPACDDVLEFLTMHAQGMLFVTFFTLLFLPIGARWRMARVRARPRRWQKLLRKRRAARRRM